MRDSCAHVSSKDHRFSPEPSNQCDYVDLQSLGSDIDQLVKELQGIAKELEFSRTTPFRAKALPKTPENHNEDKDEVQCAEIESQAMSHSVFWLKGCPIVSSELQPALNTKNIVSAMYNCRDVK